MPQDLIAGYDPTGTSTITAANILNLINAATPNTAGGIGFCISTTDVAGNPVVPDAATITKWQSYLWRRVQPTSTIIYTWNSGAASDVTYLKWQSITLTQLADGSITNSKYAVLSITDDKILSVGWAKITGIPAALPPNGAAGGDLTGTYPNPTVAANAIDGTKLLSDAAVNANRAVGTNHIKNQNVLVASKIDVGATLSILRTKADVSGAEWVTKLITQLAEPDVTTETQFIRVKADGSGFEYRTGIQVFNQIRPAAMFTSAEITLTANNVAAGTVAHGLGAIPTSIRWVLRCKSADATNGYSVGDEVDAISASNNAASLINYTTGADATNVWIVQLDANPTLRKRAATVGTAIQITGANWKLVCYATL